MPTPGADPGIPVTVVGGYLGAGKTTLLNRVLRDAGGRRLAVLVNDFGDVNIDAEWIAQRTDDTIDLTNGCVCCSLAQGFAQALFELRERAQPPEHVLVEVSGVGDPERASRYARLPGYKLDGVVVVVDAESARAKAGDRYVGETVLAQIAAADLLLVNKIDCVDDATLADLHAWLAECAPRAKRIEACRADVPLAWLVGFERGPLADNAHAALADDDERPPAHGGVRTFRFELRRPLELATLHAALEALPESVLRAKGFADDGSGERRLVQVVGRRVESSHAGPWPEGAAPLLVAIATPECGEEDLRRALAPLLPAAEDLVGSDRP